MPATLTLAATAADSAGAADTTDGQAMSTRERNQRRFQAIFGHLSQEIATAARIHGRQDFTGDTFDEAVAWLRDGITVTVSCAPRSTDGQYNDRRRNHRMRLNADGSVEVLDHDYQDLEGEVLLHALGAATPACIEIAAGLTGHMQATWRNGSGPSNAGQVRTLHTMVAWAQRDDADWPQVTPLLTHGVTPAALDAWLADGWSFDQAVPFLAAEATLEVANLWRAAGKFGKRPASLAAAGIGPDADAPWLAAGFTAAQAQPWRRANLPISPADCKRLADLGWCPADYTAATDRRSGTVPSLDTIITWAQAGIGAQSATRDRGAAVQRWWAYTGGDLDEALAWYRTGIQPYVLLNLATIPHLPSLTPEFAQAWFDAGLPRDFRMSDSFQRVLMLGMDPQDYATLIDRHPHRDNDEWAFADRLEAVQRFLDATPPPPPRRR